MNNTQKIKAMQLVTVTAVIFFVLLIMALIMNLVKLTSYNSKINDLEAQLAQLNAIVGENQQEIDYRKTDEFIDRYAREYLNMIGKGDTAYVGK